MKLVVISHTEHYYNDLGELVGWGSTINELNHLLEIFEEIYHCAPLYNTKAPLNCLSYSDVNRIKFVPLKPYGGEKLFEKVSVLTTAPYNIKKVRRTLKKADIYQFRAPTGMGVYMIPFLKLFAGKKGWFKYAGNWKQTNTSLGYRIQKYFLTHFNGNKVTINGKWPDQPDHCRSFENPCLEEKDLERGSEAIKSKYYSGTLDFIFIGRLEDAKGVHRIIESLESIKNPRIGKIHLIGDGPQRSKYQEFVKGSIHNYIFHGFLDRTTIFELLSISHVFLLPSDSEGFPKVLAEASNFGCLPIVSDISCLSDYVEDDKSGFLIDITQKDYLQGVIEKVCNASGNELRSMAMEAQRNSKLFTFNYYCNRIVNEIIG